MIRLLALSALLACALASQQNQKRPRAQPQRTRAVQQGPDNLPLVVRVLPDAQEQQRAAAQYLEEQQHQSTAEAWTIGVAVFTAMILALQFVAFVYQGGKLRDSVREMKNQGGQIERSVVEAGKGASAAEHTAGALAIGTRAWVASFGVEMIGDPGRDGRGKGMWFHMQWANTGPTPARALVLMANMQIEREATSGGLGAEPIPHFSRPAMPPQINGVVAPRVPLTGPGKFISDDDITALKEHRIRVFLYALAEYRTVFDADDTDLRVTEVCAELVHSGNIIPPGGDVTKAVPRVNGVPVGPQNRAT